MVKTLDHFLNLRYTQGEDNKRRKNTKANETAIYIGGNIVGIFRWRTNGNGRIVERRCFR